MNETPKNKDQEALKLKEAADEVLQTLAARFKRGSVETLLDDVGPDKVTLSSNVDSQQLTTIDTALRRNNDPDAMQPSEQDYYQLDMLYSGGPITIEVNFRVRGSVKKLSPANVVTFGPKAEALFKTVFIEDLLEELEKLKTHIEKKYAQYNLTLQFKKDTSDEELEAQQKDEDDENRESDAEIMMRKMGLVQAEITYYVEVARKDRLR
jgi:hypothetical protein